MLERLVGLLASGTEGGEIDVLDDLHALPSQVGLDLVAHLGDALRGLRPAARHSSTSAVW